jgi:hypothetical protein
MQRRDAHGFHKGWNPLDGAHGGGCPARAGVGYHPYSPIIIMGWGLAAPATSGPNQSRQMSNGKPLFGSKFNFFNFF